MLVVQDGKTALMIAAASGNHECVSIIASHGSNVDAATKSRVRVCFSWLLRRFKS